MKKRFMAMALALAIVFAVAPLALAAAHHGGPSPKPAKPAKGKPFLAKGSVVSFDATAGTLVVTVSKGSHAMRPYVGKQVTFTLSKHARILARTIHGSDGSVAYVPVSLSQVTLGSRAHVNGRLDRSNPNAPVFYAQLVKVILAPAASPSPSASPSDSPSPSTSDSATP